LKESADDIWIDMVIMV